MVSKCYVPLMGTLIWGKNQNVLLETAKKPRRKQICCRIIWKKKEKVPEFGLSDVLKLKSPPVMKSFSTIQKSTFKIASMSYQSNITKPKPNCEGTTDHQNCFPSTFFFDIVPEYAYYEKT